jgi:hypothetical protein
MSAITKLTMAAMNRKCFSFRAAGSDQESTTLNTLAGTCVPLLK